MQKFFSTEAQRLIKEVKKHQTIYCFDFDGTLCPIVDDPAKVKITTDVEQCLEVLCSKSPVALISGRSIEDLQKYIQFSPKYIIGNHGNEENKLDPTISSENRLKLVALNEQLLNTLPQDLLKNGLEIEDKTYSLSVHYRHTPDPENAKKEIMKCLSLIDAEIIGGKMVFNILPLRSRNKGTALLDLMKRELAEYAVFIGDDDTDEAVFSLLSPSIISVRVGHSKASQARFFIEDQSEIHSVLKCFLA